MSDADHLLARMRDFTNDLRAVNALPHIALGADAFMEYTRMFVKHAVVEGPMIFMGSPVMFSPHLGPNDVDTPIMVPAK